MDTHDSLGPASPPVGLTGRRAEMDRMRRLLDQHPGDSRVLVFEGEPGIGKSSLLRAARSMAAQAPVRVLSTVGLEAESQLPFAALHQLLAGSVSRLGAIEPTEQAALMTCFGMREGQRPDRFLIARAAASLLRAVADEQPVLVVVDDLQWVDPASLDVLAYLSRTLDGGSLALLAAARPGYDLPAFSEHAVVVAGVDDQAARDILALCSPGLPEEVRDRVMAEAVGNPLALLELPTTVHTDPTGGDDALTLSEKLQRAFTARWSELPPPTKDALLLMALQPDADVAKVLRSLTALTGAPAHASVLRPAVAVGLVRVEGRAIEFRHPLVRSGILQAEPLERRQSGHRALAEVLDDPHQRTWHLAQSIVGPDDAIAARLQASARSYEARGALLSAVTRLQRSAQLTVDSGLRGRRLLMAAQIAFELGRADLVGDLVDEARGHDLTELDGARLQWLREVLHDGNPGDATRVIDLADWAARAARADDVDLALDLLLGAALRCWWADTGPEARMHVVDVLESIDHGDDPRVVAVLGVAEPVLRGQQVHDLLAMPKYSLAAYAEDGNALRLLGMAAHAIGDSPKAYLLLGRSETLLRAHGQQGLLAHVLSMQVIVHLELGDVRGAVAAVDEGLRLARLTGQPIWNTGTLVCAARAEAMRGDTARAFELAGAAAVEAGRGRLNDLLACAALAEGLALLDTGESDAAYRAFRSLFDPASPNFHQRERFDGVMFLARSAVISGQVSDARTLLADLELVADLTPSPLLHAHLHYARAMLAPDHDRERLFRAALEQDLDVWPWVLGQTHAAFGRWLAAHARPTEALPHLQMSVDLFSRTGASLWAAQAARSLAMTRRKVIGR